MVFANGAEIFFGLNSLVPKEQKTNSLKQWKGRWGASRSQSALHMHVLVCICSNVWQFSMITGMIQVCYHTIVCT